MGYEQCTTGREAYDSIDLCFQEMIQRVRSLNLENVYVDFRN
jgi:hypothetical protein